ncbi:unnamed protein product [Cyberlindnera jadinii]|uniref:C2 NT-type domain-containing protein n=1 Tax=Cyberlindnera jadinii (strain ATCC 18201 / CBS 1600 / BCRC 20928 / JCM 3617 / NBRC 0987 / NRRL Y-1542) TaxID=983966 RepID=A0A0H5CAM7_CYBJN|nr:unnamed protein product [Cyberlindnera jadinii]
MTPCGTRGVLVVDPIEIRGLRARSASTSQVYILFQVSTTVRRTKRSPFTTSQYLKWSENSQCRFEIKPENEPNLQVFVMEYRTPLPLLLASGEVSLEDAFQQKESNAVISLKPYGQLEIELTYYAIVPVIPKKAEYTSVGDSPSDDLQSTPSPKAENIISSVDLVFVDNGVKQETSRLRRLARKVKRRYHESRRASYEHTYDRQSQANLKQLEVQVNTGKELPDTPTTPLSSSDTLFHRTSVELSDLKSEEMDGIDPLSLPFSAVDIGAQAPQKVEVLREQHEIDRVKNLKYTSFPPEVFSFLDRLQKQNVKHEDFIIDKGISGYNGDGTWSRGCLRDFPHDEEAPCLPPKIPIGMVGEEYFVLNKENYMDYFKQVYSTWC